ncbi:hypothetical protein LC653_29535 [Nostoc sp. CHAB 5784]|nr:hypothetical protein [Nostoc mirabile CHAB5784]
MSVLNPTYKIGNRTVNCDSGGALSYHLRSLQDMRSHAHQPSYMGDRFEVRLNQ